MLTAGTWASTRPATPRFPPTQTALSHSPKTIGSKTTRPTASSSLISVAWDAGHREDNLTFLADNLSPKKNESSRETLRRYLCDSFFKDHLQTYKKRPIYWLFSSGKQKAFQCLVYLHRYNEGTLARMRTEYVIPLQGMMASRVRQLEDDIDAATSVAHRRRLEKDQATLVKQQSELRDFDEKLRHYADQTHRP